MRRGVASVVARGACRKAEAQEGQGAGGRVYACACACTSTRVRVTSTFNQTPPLSTQTRGSKLLNTERKGNATGNACAALPKLSSLG